ncbi:unnamed protein product [Acanthoscelides obtectus]|uniref:Uncharacterized protein n=1 Tax=Acanthoscelides obtectus TaxID=200917 RepID=A0A9P0JGQ7_ACAOB|nr:unnamed protein product [Acanthoscelides obtectus]CAK1624915.1 hypothetical protein AOBTE_LOCUS2850 [Acanthoscelides obtectus]
MSTYSEDHSSENQTVFVNIIKQYPVLLEKSNIPEIKNKRRKAGEEIKETVLLWQVAHKKSVDYTPMLKKKQSPKKHLEVQDQY